MLCRERPLILNVSSSQTPNPLSDGFDARDPAAADAPDKSRTDPKADPAAETEAPKAAGTTPKPETQTDRSPARERAGAGSGQDGGQGGDKRSLKDRQAERQAEKQAQKQAAKQARLAQKLADRQAQRAAEDKQGNQHKGQQGQGQGKTAGPGPQKTGAAAQGSARAGAQPQVPALREDTGLPANKPQTQPGPAKKPQQKPASSPPVPPTVPMARPRGRHWMALLTFVLMVLAPISVTGWYLWERAVPQYASFVGFSVRTEEKGSAIELLGGVTDLSGSSSSDTDILYEFLQGQELVAAVNAELDLRRLWSKADPKIDPVFSYHPPGTIEDLVKHWERKVRIYYDSGTGLIDLRVLAFDPDDATAIADEIYRRSSAMINQLSAVAREDAISYAREELTQAEDRLRDARVAIQSFRNRTQIIDPTIQTQTQSGLIGALETQLAEAQIELRLLQETARATDPRIKQTELKIDVIQQQIAAERNELGLEGENGNSSVADLVGEYEALAVDLEFAQEAYTAARATYDQARNEARRQSRYLAAHVTPTRAEAAKFPDRTTIMALVSLFLFLFWAVTILVAYSLRDRR